MAEALHMGRCYRTIASANGLTEREAGMLALLLDGRSASYIQEILHASMSTAKSHICRTYQKRGIHKCQGIISMAKEGMRPR